jgi:hypothetical protein
VFGVLRHAGIPFAVTLERTYAKGPTGVGSGQAGDQLVKIPAGVHRCTRGYFIKGNHRTYEITVPGHTRILFHRGNLEADSEGCVLVGERFHQFTGGPGIASSIEGFQEFMDLAAGRPAFDLDVIEADA